jgi:hypothetical protein
MSLFELIAVVLTVTAVFSYVNVRLFHLPTAACSLHNRSSWLQVVRVTQNSMTAPHITRRTKPNNCTLTGRPLRVIRRNPPLE